MYKKYQVVNSKTKEVLEEFESMGAAEKFMVIMQSKGVQTTVITDADDLKETPNEFNIEGLDIVEPEVEFGSELDDEYGDNSHLDFENSDPDYEVEE